MLELYYRN